jgi:hypothetical protein
MNNPRRTRRYVAGSGIGLGITGKLSGKVVMELNDDLLLL